MKDPACPRTGSSQQGWWSCSPLASPILQRPSRKLRLDANYQKGTCNLDLYNFLDCSREEEWNVWFFTVICWDCVVWMRESRPWRSSGETTMLYLLALCSGVLLPFWFSSVGCGLVCLVTKPGQRPDGHSFKPRPNKYFYSRRHQAKEMVLETVAENMKQDALISAWYYIIRWLYHLRPFDETFLFSRSQFLFFFAGF